METRCKLGYKFEIDKQYSNAIIQQNEKEPGSLDSRKNMMINLAF